MSYQCGRTHRQIWWLAGQFVLLVMACLGLTTCDMKLGVAIQSIGELSRQEDESDAPSGPYVLVLGIAQDAGYPQAGCGRACCQPAWDNASRSRDVACLAIVDPISRERWLIDATPGFPSQLRRLQQATWKGDAKTPVEGVLLTHAHIGHYTGLMHLGREAMGTHNVRVYAMPRMAAFLESQGPWSQLVELKNINVERIAAGAKVQLNKRLSVTPIPVPHRDEFSETVGFLIKGPDQSVFYLPDIDKWERWEVEIESLIEKVDLAYVDGTFFDDGEVPGRAMSEIPHPFIRESMQRFVALSKDNRSKVAFIHLNHTNPALDLGSNASAEIKRRGFRVAEQGERFGLD